MAAAKLDKNEAAFLKVLYQDDPKGEMWTAAWRVGDAIQAHGGDAVAATLEGSFAVAKHLYGRKLVDKVPGRATKLQNGYAINQKGIDALTDDGHIGEDGEGE